MTVSQKTPKTAAPTMAGQDWAMLVLLSIIWGGSFLFARIAVQEVPPLTLVLLRVALASLTLNIVIWLSVKANGAALPWRSFAAMGLLNNVIPFGLIFYGQQEIGAGLAAIINAMTPIWTVLIAHVATGDERLSGQKLFAVLLGFGGVIVLIGFDALGGLSTSVIAQLAVLGATISYGCAGVFGKRFAGVPPLQTANGQLTMSTAMMLPLALFVDRPWTLPMPSLETLFSVLALAIVCTALAYLLFFRILARAGAVNISLVTLLVPVSAIILGGAVLGERLEPRHAAGMALIMLSLIIIDGRWRNWLIKNPVSGGGKTG
ncbi:MAG: DMT family transporter [Pseudomonadota bacterium]